MFAFCIRLIRSWRCRVLRATRHPWVMVWCALAGSVAAADVSAQTCPASDPNQNYNCPIGPSYLLPSWGNVPWSLPQHYQDILSGDLDGDGKDELVGRDALGVHVWSFNTALGTWQPWLTTNGTGELVLPLTDAVGWDLPEYYTTLRLMNLPGRHGKVLAGRGASGLLLYGLTRGSGPVTAFPAGTWTQLAPGGPFANADCFSNLKCWDSAPYYQTIRFGDIDGEPGDEVIGWGGDGGVAFKWNGSEWVSLTGFPPGIDAAPYYPAIVLSRQFADVDGEPGQELLNWEQEGIRVHKFVPGPNGGAWTELALLAAFGVPSCIDSNGGSNPSCWSTLQTAPWSSGGAAVLMRFPKCNNIDGGMSGAQYNPTSRAWNMLFTAGPFDDCSGFTQPQYYETIQVARITGNALPELIGRGPDGILVYQWNGTSWVPLSTNVPALSDPLWASDPSYWQTIKTAMIDGTGRAALLARGQTGMRTWLYQNGTLARPVPYGNFAPFTGRQGTNFGALNGHLMLGSGTIRDTYTNPSIDNTSSALRGYIGTIVTIGKGCQDAVSSDPPQYQSCDTSAVTNAFNPEYTQVVNQIVKELWWAANVVDHFTTIQTMRGEFFTTENSEFPSLAGNLQLPQASGESGGANYLNLFASILKVIAALTGQPEVAAAGNAISAGVSVVPLFANPRQATFQHTYSQIQTQIASVQETMKSSNLAQKHHVLSDYALLGTVGQLVGSQVWTLDEDGYLSANRQAFTLWIYQTFLPLQWGLWEVTNCVNDLPYVTCTPPPSGPYLASYGSGGVNFSGLFPSQMPCTTYQGETTCSWTLPDPTTVNALFTPVSPQCTYMAGSGSAWVYAGTGKTACTLGVGTEIFNNEGGWNFQVSPLNVHDYALVLNATSSASSLNDLQLQPSVRLQGFAPFSVDIDLRTVQLRVNGLLREAGGSEELVKDIVGNEFVPIALQPQSRASAGLATFETPAGQTPHINAVVQVKPRRAIGFDISVDQAAVVDPQLCIGSPPTARLQVALQLSGGGLQAPVTFAQVQDWECVSDDRGTLRLLRTKGHPASVVFLP